MASFLQRLTTTKSSPDLRSGFTLTEVLVSGSMLSMVMASMAQFTVSSLSSSAATAQRQRIEGAINDNIQLIYQADIRLAKSFETNKTSLANACKHPAAFLATVLSQPSGETFVPAPIVPGGSPNERIKRTITPDQFTGLTKVVYQFRGPEHNIQKEQRILEVHPRFQIHCGLTEKANIDSAETSPTQPRTPSKKKQRKPKQASKKQRSPKATQPSRTSKQPQQTTTPSQPDKPATKQQKRRQISPKNIASSRASNRCRKALRQRRKCG